MLEIMCCVLIGNALFVCLLACLSAVAAEIVALPKLLCVQWFGRPIRVCRGVV
jgi:hypothetical protein